jgi:hypothetical protein
MTARYADVVAHAYVYGPSAGRPLGGYLPEADRRRLRKQNRRLAEVELELLSGSPAAGTSQPPADSSPANAPRRRARTIGATVRALVAVVLRARWSPA